MSAPQSDDADAPRGRHALARLGSGKGRLLGAAAFIALGIGAQAYIWLKPPPAPKKDPKAEVTLPRSTVTYQPPQDAPTAPAKEVVPVGFSVPPPKPLREVMRTTAPRADKPVDPLEAARKAPISTFSGGGGGSNRADPEKAAAAREEAEDGRELAQRLRPTRMAGTRAVLLPDRPYVLTRGHQIPCVLVNAIDSTQPGQVKCRIPQDVPGPTGITLLDRGTLVVGEFQSAIRQGQERMFVLWVRAETPRGVLVDLDSPAADAMGRSGVGGEIETHFWSRLSGAVMTSLVDGAFAMALSQANGMTGANLNGSKAQSAADDALGNSVNIRPTLKVNQGITLTIDLSRDVSFRDVYAMQVAR